MRKKGKKSIALNRDCIKVLYKTKAFEKFFDVTNQFSEYGNVFASFQEFAYFYFKIKRKINIFLHEILSKRDWAWTRTASTNPLGNGISFIGKKNSQSQQTFSAKRKTIKHYHHSHIPSHIERGKKR